MSKFALISLLLVLVTGHCEGYYWRTWNGTVPEDALLGGIDSRGPYYVARAWLPEKGFYIGQVFNGQTEIDISWSTGGNILSSDTIEVLCTLTINPVWHTSNATITYYILEDSALVKPVVGGKSTVYEFNPVYIGRVVRADGFGYIGSVHTDYYMYYAYGNGTGHYSWYYDLLVEEKIFANQQLDHDTIDSKFAEMEI